MNFDKGLKKQLRNTFLRANYFLFFLFLNPSLRAQPFIVKEVIGGSAQIGRIFNTGAVPPVMPMRGSAGLRQVSPSAVQFSNRGNDKRASSVSAAAAGLNKEELKKATVLLEATNQSPDFLSPWSRYKDARGFGSGFVVETKWGKRILTNAHVALNNKNMIVYKAGRPFAAIVEKVGHDTELAMVNVPDPSFFADVKAIPLGDLPEEQDEVFAIGFPHAGIVPSFTKGIISRMQVTPYVLTGRKLMLIQTDAAINPGNSGGPVVKDGRLAGVSVQLLIGSQNMGYIVPITYVEKFFKDIEDGSYDGRPELGALFQKLENLALRSFLGLKANQTGMVVTDTVYGSPAWGVLQKDDVIAAIDGMAVDNDGTVMVDGYRRIELFYPVSLRQMGERISIDLIRKGEPMRVQVVLKPFERLIPGPKYDIEPTYYIFGGFIFVPLSYNNLHAMGNSADPGFWQSYNYGSRSTEKKEVVVVLRVLANNEVNQGYQSLSNAVVTEVNGVRISEIKDVIGAIERHQGPFDEIKINKNADFGSRIVLNSELARRLNVEILRHYGIPSDRSEDLK
ncbi:MAG: trypsin-like peptidase domain-containing protein [Elusimicrobia bacterium]|nr:trypsin-like peptidase domain-containing protein [Elusimicrobiota bacterium]